MRALIACLSLVVATAMAPQPAAALSDDALYRALGEKAGIERVIETLLHRSLADPRIADTFEGANFERREEKLVLQICELAGGPCVYDGLSMADSHMGQELTTAHFTALVENLRAAMAAEGVGFRAQNRLLALLAPMHRDVVTKP